MFFLYVFILLLVVNVTSGGKKPCPLEVAIDITLGTTKSDGSTYHNGTSYQKNNYFYQDDSIYGCVCNIKNCIRKCCGPNMAIVNKTCVDQDIKFEFDVYKGTEIITDYHDFYIIHNFTCKQRWTVTFPDFTDPSNSENFYVQSNGHIYFPNSENSIKDFSPEMYCLENFVYDEDMQFSALICAQPELIHEHENTGMIISMPFLLATFIAYALLPDRNLHMKALMFYVINLMFGYLLLVIVQLTDEKFDDTSCVLIGYFCLFFFMVSFFWMNVICIDIWFAFSGLRGFSGSKKLAERKRFLFYCGYAWGFPILHTLVVFSIQKLTKAGTLFNPDIGNGQCFFRRGYPELLYFYGPMGILITINVIFFAITAIKIRSVKKDTSVLKKEDSKRHSYENDTQTFNLYLKLLFAMGINWTMEIISWAMIWANVAPDYIWYLTDFCNAIYGVFIFFIFVFKKNIWRLLKKRYYSFRGRPHLAHMTSTNATRTTSYSTAHSLHENPHGIPNDSTVLTSET